jgi:hypothetical protein
MASINLTYKGLTGLRRTITGFDDTTSIDDLIAAIAADEELETNYYIISKEGDPSNTLSFIYGDSSTPASVSSLGIETGDVIICKPNSRGTTKQTRQVMKLDIAQKKREGGPDDDTTAVFYRSNNSYDLTSLPDTYNGNVPGADDNPNTGGLIQKRPWVAVGAIAEPQSINEAVEGGSITDLEIWYDGADESTIVPTGIQDEDNINQWNDKSGLAHNLNFSGGNNKPTYESSDTQNTYGYVQFADGDLMSINPLSSLSGATAFTVFVIARGTSLATNSPQLLTSTENGELSIQFDSDGTARFKVGAQNGTTAAGTVDEDEWNVFTLVYNGTNNIVGRVNNGTTIVDTSSGTPATGPAAMNAGSTYLYVGGDNTGGTFIGDIGEVILFKKALSATEYANVENYLTTKWGI